MVGIEASGREALLPAHAGTHQHDRLAVPVGAAADIVERARVAEIHVEKIGGLAAFRSDPGIVARRRGLGRRHVVRIDVERQPALGRARGRCLGHERIDAGILEDHQRRIFARLCRLGEIAADMAAEAVQRHCRQFDAGLGGRGRLQHRVDRHLPELRQLACPEGVEIGRTRGRGLERQRRDRCGYGEPVALLRRQLRDVDGLRSVGQRGQLHPQHSRPIQSCFDRADAALQVDGAAGDHRAVVLPDLIAETLGAKAQRHAQRPADSFSHGIDAIAMEWLEGDGRVEAAYGGARCGWWRLRRGGGGQHQRDCAGYGMSHLHSPPRHHAFPAPMGFSVQ